ncbi:sodium-independent sulfate anion transporter-like isoform X2 [Conger conger]|uniref:sodium-independent sulfate anion transporter-like isoform X2 n=1 Tax=Conger conger TaxID=82655 RepID=UPI002A59C2C7|nr:sodium-independent sulfate anion transporter-like isoform X2 [Conger conger]
MWRSRRDRMELQEEHSWQDRKQERFSYATLKAHLPVLGWLPRYRRAWLQMDLIAGATVGLTTVPMALAYAEVAGLPVQYGLYSAFMGGFVYCIFGTAKDLALGPTGIMSLLCARHVHHDPVYAVLLTFLCGIIQVAVALLKLGFLLDLISSPVIKGFTCAAAITIGFGQLKNILGLREVPHQFFQQIYHSLCRIPECRLGDVTLGLLCLCLLATLMRMKNSGNSAGDLPAQSHARILLRGLVTARCALVVIGATAVAYACQESGHGIFTIMGSTTQGLPPLRAPPFSEITPEGDVITFSEIAQGLGGGLVVIPFMGLLESIAIAKAFSSQNNYQIDTNQEVFAIGLTNILGSFVSAYPVTGSFGRSAVNSQTGVSTPLGGVVTGLIVLLSLAFLMPLFCYVPKAALAAVIICSVAPLADLRVAKEIWKGGGVDLVSFLVTFLVSFWEVQYGIVGGVAVSGAICLFSLIRAKHSVNDSIHHS